MIIKWKRNRLSMNGQNRLEYGLVENQGQTSTIDYQIQLIE